MTDSDRTSQWDTVSTIPCPPPDSTRRNLEQSRAQLLVERERAETKRDRALSDMRVLDAEIAEIDRRLDAGEHS